MSTIERKKSAIHKKAKSTPVSPKTGRYASVEAASLAKIAQAEPYIANIDMTLFKKNGHVE